MGIFHRQSVGKPVEPAERAPEKVGPLDHDAAVSWLKEHCPELGPVVIANTMIRAHNNLMGTTAQQLPGHRTLWINEVPNESGMVWIQVENEFRPAAHGGLIEIQEWIGQPRA